MASRYRQEQRSEEVNLKDERYSTIQTMLKRAQYALDTCHEDNRNGWKKVIRACAQELLTRMTKGEYK